MLMIIMLVACHFQSAHSCELRRPHVVDGLTDSLYLVVASSEFAVNLVLSGTFTPDFLNPLVRTFQCFSRCLTFALGAEPPAYLTSRHYVAKLLYFYLASFGSGFFLVFLFIFRVVFCHS
jgi:hypothetical protein